MSASMSATNPIFCPRCASPATIAASSLLREPRAGERWRAMLSEAEVLFGLPGDSPEGLADAIRSNDRLRWVQATAGGAGEQVQAAGLTAGARQGY